MSNPTVNHPRCRVKSDTRRLTHGKGTAARTTTIRPTWGLRTGKDGDGPVRARGDTAQDPHADRLRSHVKSPLLRARVLGHHGFVGRRL
jgi:hypothetical protein